MKKAQVVVVFALACSIAYLEAATETVVDRDGRIDFGASTIAPNDAVFVDPGVASVTKMCAGEWMLPFGNFFAFGTGFEFGLLRGTLTLTDGTHVDYVTTPPSVLYDSAFWIEAGKNCATNASGYVTSWHDVRENSAAAKNYGYAEAYSSVLTGGAEGLVVAMKDGRPSVAFRAYASGNLNRSFELRTVSGAAATYDMYDGFYVVSPRGSAVSENQHAPIFGNMSKGYFFSGVKGTGAMLSEDGNAEWKSYTCTYRHNGAIEDPTMAVNGTACHVCEFSVCNSLSIPVDSLVRDRNLASGGVFLHEVLIFTRHLSQVERAQVTAYLMQKWNVATGTMKIKGADGTVVKISDDLANKLDISGGTAVGPSGDSLAPSLQYSARGKDKRYRLETSGGYLNAQGTEYSLMLRDGDNVMIDDSLTTNRIVRNVLGSAGAISLSGAQREVVVDQMPASKLTAISDNGDIVLRARTGVTSSYRGGEPATLSSTSLVVPAGTGGVTTSVTIPTAGDWEVEFNIQNEAGFKAGSGWTDGRTTSYRVMLVDHTELLDKIAITVKPSEIGGVLPHRRYLIRGMAAGTYTLMFAGFQATTIAATVSNLAFVFVPNSERETVVPVTEGDFDSMTMSRPYFSSRDNFTFTKWKIANGQGIAANPVVQSIVNSMMGIASTGDGYNLSFRAYDLGRYGDNSLMWIHTNSTASAVRNTATSPATILPAGTWKLRMKACRMTTGPDEFRQSATGDRIGMNPIDKTRRCGKAFAKYQASVVVNGGVPVDLGVTDEVNSFLGETYYFPNSFTVAEGDSVIVNLDQLIGWSFSMTDDYEFVKVQDLPASGLGPELILDGSFESDGKGVTAYWTRDNYNDGSAHRVDLLNPVGVNYGGTQCDGNYAARSFNGARCYQPVNLEKGVYRLSYWSRARCDMSGGRSGVPCYQCQLHFWYAEENAAMTNHIVTGDTLWCTNFYETIALFEVKSAGRYFVGFNADQKDVISANDSLTDCISVRKVLDVTGVPDIDPNAELILKPKNGKVRLDYPGVLNVKKLRVNGKGFYGEVSAETHPQYLSGPGKVVVLDSRPGMSIVIR